MQLFVMHARPQLLSLPWSSGDDCRWVTWQAAAAGGEAADSGMLRGAAARHVRAAVGRVVGGPEAGRWAGPPGGPGPPAPRLLPGGPLRGLPLPLSPLITQRPQRCGIHSCPALPHESNCSLPEGGWQPRLARGPCAGVMHANISPPFSASAW